MNATISIPVLLQKTTVIRFLAGTALTTSRFQHSQTKCRFHHWHSCYVTVKFIIIIFKEAILCFVRTWEFLEPMLCKTFNSLACDTLIENSMRNLWKSTCNKKLWSVVLHFDQDHHSLQMVSQLADHLAPYCDHFSIHLKPLYAIALHFLQSWSSGYTARI
jgi:hypothetical protein